MEFYCNVKLSTKKTVFFFTGPLKPEWTVKYGAVGLIFFISGMTISFNDFFYAATKVKVHLFVLFFTFLFVPTLVLILNIILRVFFGTNEWILKG